MSSRYQPKGPVHKAEDEDINISNTTTEKKPKPRHRTTRQYDFLQYSRLVFKWAVENYDLNRNQIDLLLYLYPKAVFTKSEFMHFHRTMGIWESKTLNMLIDKGFIRIWRKKKGKDRQLYELTDKGRRLCSRMHRMCTGEEEIPMTAATNKMVKNKDHDNTPRINQYWLKMMERSNREIRK